VGFVRDTKGLFRFRYDAEEITARVLEDNKIGALTISPRVLLCANAQQTLDFSLLIWRVKIKMNPTAASGTMIACLK